MFHLLLLVGDAGQALAGHKDEDLQPGFTQEVGKGTSSKKTQTSLSACFGLKLKHFFPRISNLSDCFGLTPTHLFPRISKRWESAWVAQQLLVYWGVELTGFLVPHQKKDMGVAVEPTHLSCPCLP